jgi:hypothetical protein
MYVYLILLIASERNNLASMTFCLSRSALPSFKINVTIFLSKSLYIFETFQGQMSLHSSFSCDIGYPELLLRSL